MQNQTFYSNGKLLLTGEYVVLDGAKALAVPTRFGQNLVVKKGSNQLIKWVSFDADETIWFQDTITFEEIKNKSLNETNDKIKNTLIEILYQAFMQQPDFLTTEGYEIETHLTFPRIWGLGTSSTLINNIGQWLQIDAFELLSKSFGGSGYDVACAQTNLPIIYQLENEIPHFKAIHFNPQFKENIHFVYLNQKQSSKSAISNYLTQRHKTGKIISKINTITYQAIDCKEGKEFAKLMEQHEIIMSDVLETKTVQEKLFPDFKGVVKSLGAWGGDFVMVLSKENPKDYFLQKGYTTVLSYEEMVLQ
ncbi:GYDIA family GHMP kinase [Flavobacterium celericrescens]|uniref:GHMP kinase n=1 Tax=Flavobacterium celericrescens TaxID=2709780 RepID=A0ABX0ICG9_9FLAO|nr:GYDIA family GHMP kinase [Flavobacterium celericrescens]NHM04911.1 GHMP kinase [Flavobacterium celericrescens]